MKYIFCTLENGNTIYLNAEDISAIIETSTDDLTSSNIYLKNGAIIKVEDNPDDIYSAICTIMGIEAEAIGVN